MQKDPAKVAAAYKGLLEKNKVVISPAYHLSREDLLRWGKNFLRFVAPTLAVFFGQLAVGVSWKIALPVAILALYQSLSDLFGKWQTTTFSKPLPPEVLTDEKSTKLQIKESKK